MIVAHVLPEQAFIQPSAISLEEVLEISSGRENESHYISLEKSEESKAQRLVDDMSIEEIPEEHDGQIRRMLKQHARMWNGKMGEISVTKHRIKLLSGGRPVRSQPYRLGQSARKFEDDTVTKLLEEGAIVPSKSECASPVVIANRPRSDMLRFCIDF